MVGETVQQRAGEPLRPDLFGGLGFTTTSLVTPRCGAIPLDRLCVADDSLWRHAYAVRKASHRVKTPVSG